ncbi:hypothetical protein MASR1M32_10500 [Rhodobacter sp.]
MGDEHPDEGVFDPAIEAGWLNPDDLSQALTDVMQERDRQISEEGWTPEHDDQHVDSEMAAAAACYAIATVEGDGPDQPAPLNWPWMDRWWKPKDARSNLVRAAALIIAEIERLDRAAAPLKGGGA